VNGTGSSAGTESYTAHHAPPSRRPLERREISFGAFRLVPSERLLLEGDTALRIGSRALDLLIALVERPGEVIGKSELLARVWPNTLVAESNLKVHIAGLRRVIGDGTEDRRYIISVPGRGYCFVAPVTFKHVRPTPREIAPTRQTHNLPTLPSRLVGRAGSIRLIARETPRQRLMTIVGPGGIGKSSVALAAAREMADGYKDGVWVVDLASTADDRMVPAALAAVLGLASPVPKQIGVLHDRRMLVVLDGCEHVLRGARQLATDLLGSNPNVEIVATSRVPLGITDERLHQIGPLEIPPPSAELSAVEALHFPAIQLLIEEAAASHGDFELRDEDASVAADICRQLDGTPLAIELAATRLATFGLRALMPRLDNALRFLVHNRRRVLARHRSMRATLDWSHRLLGETEQRVMRRLAVFAGSFTRQAGGAISVDVNLTQRDTERAVSELARQSLISVDVSGAEPQYRFLHMTRAYALEKLIESGEFDMLARRHDQDEAAD
jgi:predicted ATPase/DNA-binding winged helix-turn-helix (wHTH) protein